MTLKTSKNKYKQKAFTLLEVLVALAVLTLGLGAVIKVASSQSSQLSYLKNKTIALWVANNKSNEIQLEGWPGVGVSSGQTLMAKQEWRWKLNVSNTADKDLRRLDIEINQKHEEGEPVVRFISFIGKKGKNIKVP